MNLEIYVKGYRFLSFAKNIGIYATKVTKSMINKYSQKLLDSAKKSKTDAIKTASKRAIQKTAEATDYLIGKKIADKISISKSPKEFHSKELHSKTDENEIQIPKERYISFKGISLKGIPFIKCFKRLAFKNR